MRGVNMKINFNIILPSALLSESQYLITCFNCRHKAYLNAYLYIREFITVDHS